MRKDLHNIEEFRVLTGPYATRPYSGIPGQFVIKTRGRKLRVLASDGEGWEHVSVSVNDKRCPTWGEMCFIKDLFWEPDEAVFQIHPPHSDYRNLHEFVLHLWRQIDQSFPLPDGDMVGPKGVSQEQAKNMSIKELYEATGRDIKTGEKI